MSNVMVVGEDRPRCKIILDDEQLERVKEIKCLGYILNKKKNG